VASVLKERLGISAVSAREGGIIRLRGLPPDGPPEMQGDQAYTLSVSEGRIEIGTQAPVGVFYAAQALCQLAGERADCAPVRIADWPAIENRLVMIAVTQGAFQVIDMEYWKRLIRELAAVKMTHIMAYFEGGTFVYEKYPFLADKGRDGFTIEKGKLLSEYAKEHFIELLPQQQCLGHSGVTLLHEELANLRESGDVFCPSKPETYAFLGDLFDELCEAFPYARWTHVGGDEFAHGFAQCEACKKRAAEIGPEGLYAEHLMKLREMLAQRNRKMMIWWHEQGYTEKAADRLAKDIAIFDWHYGNQAAYPSLERLQNLGFSETWATPAITRYYDASNDWDNTFGNVSGFMKAGAERKVPGECTCTWVHGIWGGRNLFELNLYGLVFSADCAWSPLPADYADFRWRFARHWFGLQQGDLERQVREAIHYAYGEPKEEGFWSSNRTPEEMLAAPLAKTTEEIRNRPEIVAEAQRLLGFCDRAQAVLTTWEQAATRNQVTVKYAGQDVLIHKTLATRTIAVAGLVEAWEKAKALPVEQRAAALAEPLGQLGEVVADYAAIEQGFRDSVLEAGGGECGSGGWYPFIAKGGVIFRAQEGRAEVEKQLAHIREAMAKETMPERPFVE
jgi:hypothetical protein